MLRWRNWRLKCVDVQERALKLCPVPYVCVVQLYETVLIADLYRTLDFVYIHNKLFSDIK